MTAPLPAERDREGEAPDTADLDRITARERGGHWLIFDWSQPRGAIAGCHCGFEADVEQDAGYGDTVVEHIASVVRAESATALDAARAELAKALTDLANWQHRARRDEDTVTALRRLLRADRERIRSDILALMPDVGWPDSEGAAERQRERDLLARAAAVTRACADCSRTQPGIACAACGFAGKASDD